MMRLMTRFTDTEQSYISKVAHAESMKMGETLVAILLFVWISSWAMIAFDYSTTSNYIARLEQRIDELEAKENPNSQ